MIEECRAYGLEEPELIDAEGDFRINLYRKNAIGSAVAPNIQGKRTDGEIIPIVKDNQTDGQTDGQMNGKTTATEDKILQINCEDASVTQDEIAERIGISNSGVRYAMRKMKSRGILKRVGSHKNGKWQINKKLECNSSDRVLHVDLSPGCFSKALHFGCDHYVQTSVQRFRKTDG